MTRIGINSALALILLMVLSGCCVSRVGSGGCVGGCGGDIIVENAGCDCSSCGGGEIALETVVEPDCGCASSGCGGNCGAGFGGGTCAGGCGIMGGCGRPHGGCGFGGHLSRFILPWIQGHLSCGSGCGEVYWHEWINDPPDCTDPCDNYGQFIGPRLFGPKPWLPLGISNLWGRRLCGGGCGSCGSEGPVDIGCCGECDHSGCASTHSDQSNGDVQLADNSQISSPIETVSNHTPKLVERRIPDEKPVQFSSSRPHYANENIRR